MGPTYAQCTHSTVGPPHRMELYYETILEIGIGIPHTLRYDIEIGILFYRKKELDIGISILVFKISN